MASSDRSSPQSYVPANPPAPNAESISRATWDEFYRLSAFLANADRPLALAVTKTEIMPVQPATVWTRLFDAVAQVEWEVPEGQLAADGTWTCQQEGLYNIMVIAEMDAFPNPGSRLYTATLRTILAGVTLLSKTGGADDAPLRLVANFVRKLKRGDTATFDLDLTEESFSGNVNVFGVLNITRMGSAR